MAQRDRIVFETCKKMRIPVAWNLAGGYHGIVTAGYRRFSKFTVKRLPLVSMSSLLSLGGITDRNGVYHLKGYRRMESAESIAQKLRSINPWLRKSLGSDPRDGDGDGYIFDGTPQQRAVSMQEVSGAKSDAGKLAVLYRIAEDKKAFEEMLLGAGVLPNRIADAKRWASFGLKEVLAEGKSLSDEWRKSRSEYDRYDKDVFAKKTSDDQVDHEGES